MVDDDSASMALDRWYISHPILTMSWIVLHAKGAHGSIEIFEETRMRHVEDDVT